MQSGQETENFRPKFLTHGNGFKMVQYKSQEVVEKVRVVFSAIFLAREAVMIVDVCLHLHAFTLDGIHKDAILCHML